VCIPAAYRFGLSSLLLISSTLISSAPSLVSRAPSLVSTTLSLVSTTLVLLLRLSRDAPLIESVNLSNLADVVETVLLSDPSQNAQPTIAAKVILCSAFVIHMEAGPAGGAITGVGIVLILSSLSSLASN
jgi:hypothetical protein